MVEYKVEQAWITYRWTFDTILAGLPTPGTPAFSTLCRELRPYGISPSGISLESPSAFLSDVAYRIILLDRRATLRISYSGFEMLVDPSVEGDEELLVNILDSVFSILGETDANVNSGKAEVTLYSHMTLLETDVDAFLRKHLPEANTESSLIPEVFGYSIKSDDASDMSKTRVIILKSEQYDNAISVNFSFIYTAPEKPAQTSERVSRDGEHALALIGLKRGRIGKEENSL
jgi:hypothetical protein